MSAKLQALDFPAYKPPKEVIHGEPTAAVKVVVEAAVAAAIAEL